VSYQLRNKSSMIRRIIVHLGVVTVLLGTLTGCLLGTPDGANLRVSAAQQLRAAGYYGFLADVEAVTVRIFVDTDAAGATDATDPLFAEIVLNEGNGWSVTAPNVPTMTRLLITAEATGTGGNHIGELFGGDAVTEGGVVTLFTGSASAFVTSASAQVSLVLTPFNDGRLNRLPRLEQIRSNLNAGTIDITFNDYGDDDTWWWRVVEERNGNSTVASDSFRRAGVAENDPGAPEGQVVFSGATAGGSGPDVQLEYLFPQGDDTDVDWFNRPYWLEIANLQHNMLRQPFVVNPGQETGFVVNFAPFITGITAGRYRTGSTDDGYSETIRWELNAQDVDSPDPSDDGDSIRALWILELEDRYVLHGNIKEDSLGATGITQDTVASWVSILKSDTIDLETREGLSQQILAHLDDLTVSGERGSARSLEIGGSGDTPDIVSQDDAWKLAVRGDLFDEGATGNLFILVFDRAVLPDENPSDGEPLQYAWSYIRMNVDQFSFPDQSGLVVFDGAILDTPGIPTLRVGSVGPAGGRIFRVEESADGETPFTYYETWWIDAPGGNRTWDSAQEYAEQFEGGGKSDWRLPTTEELQFMYRNRGALGGFVTGPFYWSGEAFGTDLANVLDFSNPSELIRPEAQDSLLSVRIVRTFQR